MQQALKVEIKRLCRRIADRRAAESSRDAEYQRKFEKRTGKSPGATAPSNTGPPDRHFDPAYCARNANFLAKTIWEKVRLGTYTPRPALTFLVPKPRGGTRQIMAFTIPDAALANLVMWRARERNLKRLSPFSYAYHPHLNVFDAVLALSGYIAENKLFAVQIDFEKYFDSIPTGYLKECIDDEALVSLTPHEKLVLKALLNHQYATREGFQSSTFTRRFRGTPQGCSASLLLANLANHSLDRALERHAGRFVRFADDVVALCGTYEEAQNLEGSFSTHCSAHGLTINKIKSPGIAIIDDPAAEMRTAPHFDYLGYRFTRKHLSIPDHVKSRIKQKLSRLIQIYLIQYPLKYGFNRKRRGFRPAYDWDLLGLITELRGYLYGGLRELEVRSFLNHGTRLRRMRGLMGFYALLDDKAALQELDGWLVNNIRRAMRKRHEVLRANYKLGGLRPSNRQLILGTWLDPTAWDGAVLPELQLPSFVRGWRAARKHYLTFGLEDVEPPSNAYY